MKDDKPRKIVVHELAVDDLKAMKRDNPQAYSQMVTALKRLAHASSPVNVIELDVCRSFPHLYREGGWRVKQHGQTWRAVVRFVDDDDYVLTSEREIARDCVTIEVVFADVRSSVTYSVLLAQRVKEL